MTHVFGKDFTVWWKNIRLELDKIARNPEALEWNKLKCTKKGNYTLLSPDIDCSFDCTVQKACTATIITENSIFHSLNKIPKLGDFNDFYGVNNTTFNRRKIHSTFYKICCIVLFLITAYHSFILGFGMFLFIILIDEIQPNPEKVTVPTKLLKILQDEGFNFEWQPIFSGVKIMLWYDGKDFQVVPLETSLQCTTESIISLIPKVALLAIKDYPYRRFIYEIHTPNGSKKREAYYICDMIDNDLPTDDFFDLVTPITRYKWPFKIGDYISSLDEVKREMTDNSKMFGTRPIGAYLCISKGVNIVQLGEVNFQSVENNNTAVLSYNDKDMSSGFSWLQEAVLQNTISQYKLNAKQKRHMLTFQNYLNDLAVTSDKILLVLRNLHDCQTQYEDYLKRHIISAWLHDYIKENRVNINSLPNDTYTFICQALLSVRMYDSILHILQKKSGDYWFK